MAKWRKSPPIKCGDAYEIRCHTRDPKGIIFTCKVFRYSEDVYCADAEIDIMKGTIKFSWEK